MAEREEIIQELSVKLKLLLSRYDELKSKSGQLEKAVTTLKEENETLKQNYEHLKAAKTISMGETEIKETKLHISKLIREIDTCIALLSI